MTHEDDEMEPGVHVNSDGVFIYDQHGEIVSWDEAEFREDPQLWLAVAKVLRTYYEDGPHALRRLLNKPVGPYDALNWWQGLRTYASRPDTPEMIGEDESIDFAIRGFFAECSEAGVVEWEHDSKMFELTIHFLATGRHFHYVDGEHRLMEGYEIIGEGGVLQDGESDATQLMVERCAEFGDALFYAKSILQQRFGEKAVVYVERDGEIEVH